MKQLYNSTMRFTGMKKLCAAVVLISFLMKNAVAEPGLPDNMELLLTQKAGYEFFIHEPYEDWNSAYPATGQEIITPILFPGNKHTRDFLCETKMSVRYRLHFLQCFEAVTRVNFHNLFGRINPDFKNKNYTMNIGGLWIHPAELIIKNSNISKFESRLHIGAFPVYGLIAITNIRIPSVLLSKESNGKHPFWDSQTIPIFPYTLMISIG